MTRSEEFTLRLAQRSFLSLWCTASPRGKEIGKELCDVLVVCDPDVVIISVKEIDYKATDDVATGMSRWTSRAVDASIKQLYGAERYLSMSDRVVAKDGSPWLQLPPVERRRVHRIAVALGSKGEVPMAAGDAGRGFVHVLDEVAMQTLMNELDTISDFVEFLRDTEVFLENAKVVVPKLEDLLSLYLHRGRVYPVGADLLLLTDDVWSQFSAKEEFQRKRNADQVSYFWDSLIEYLTKSFDPDLTERYGQHSDGNPDIERVARIMARESRFSRRILADAFQEFHRGRKSRARIVPAPSGVVYVFLACPRDVERQERKSELLGRMFIARGMFSNATLVVGIATEMYDPKDGFSMDVASYEKERWTPEDQAEMERLQRLTGAFVSPLRSHDEVLEYPPPSNPSEAV